MSAVMKSSSTDMLKEPVLSPLRIIQSMERLFGLGRTERPCKRTFTVVLGIVGCTQSIWVTVPQKVVNVTVGQTVNLLCTYTTDNPKMTNLQAQWTLYPKYAENAEAVLFYEGGQQEIGQKFKNRLMVLSSINGTRNASISISNMQTTDSGSYTCEVHNFPDISGRAEASIKVNVFEKPSFPICAVHGDVSTGHLVTLTCHSSTGSPTPQYTWARIDRGLKKSVLGYTNPTTGTLYIRNISQFEFGKYQCNSSNVVGFSVCTVELSSELNDATIAGAVIGALLCVAFIILLVWFLVHKMKKQKYAKVAIPQDAVAVPPQKSEQEMKELEA
ncbi:V-set and immunoglobulin domain-containing protein 1-like [Hoplias malabaricus]|uniref:V-set and immunoglobulin domain-containing protein 1-like n=1 Tax=Hoplias malabaricus TaxID=27720 RepID=UPI0034628F67